MKLPYKNRHLPFIVLALLVFGALFFARNYQYLQLVKAGDRTTEADFRNQFYQGKACGLLTTKEATELIGEQAGTSGSVIPSDALTADSRPGSPRIDSCSHTAKQTSIGYIDIVLKTYISSDSAKKYFETDIGKKFPNEQRDAGDFGQQLFYGAGVYYLLKNEDVIEISASKSPRVTEPLTEQFTRTVLDRILVKL